MAAMDVAWRRQVTEEKFPALDLKHPSLGRRRDLEIIVEKKKKRKKLDGGQLYKQRKQRN